MRLISRVMTAVLLTAALSAPVEAQSPTYTFTLTGFGNWTWTLPQTPTPDDVFSDAAFAVYSVSVVGASAAPCELYFLTLGYGGGFIGCYVKFYGDQLFSGAIANPTFTPGTYLLSYNFDEERNGQGSLTIASSTVPEPASLALVGAGLLAMGVVARRRRV